MDERVQEGIKRIAKGERISFAELAEDHGYANARKLLRLALNAQQRQSSGKEEQEARESQSELLLRERIRLSRTIGEPTLDNPVAKMMQQKNSKHLPFDGGKIAVKRSRVDGSLSLPQANISVLPSHVGDTLTMQLARFHHVALPRNQLKTISSGELPQFTCRNWRYVTEANLSGNDIAELPRDMYLMTCLTELNLERNRLGGLPDTFLQLESLRVLNLGSNVFSSIPDDLGELESLEVLHLQNNMITRLPHSLPAFTQLRYLDLSGNGMADLSVPNKGRPDQLRDKLGRLFNLETLKLNENRLRELPRSIGQLTALRVLEACKNFIVELPPTTGGMERLEVLKLNDNELPTLPKSFSQLSSLRSLILTNNVFAHLPEYVGHCSALEKIYLGNNAIRKIPYSIGYLAYLRDLQVFNNPLDDPPYEVVDQGLEKLQWVLRQKYLEHVQGPPPTVQPHHMGIELEVIQPEPEFQLRLRSLIAKSKKTHDIDLQLFGLREIPREVLEIRLKLKSMRLDGNPFGEGIGGVRDPSVQHEYEGPAFEFTQQLGTLQVLTMRSCRLDGLPRSVSLLQELNELDLDDNSMTEIPHTLTRLRKLDRLVMSKNKLYALPDSLEGFASLTELVLDNNRIQFLPDGLSQLHNLRTLRASSNWLTELNSNVVQLESLRLLDLQRNNLTDLDNVDFGLLHLEILRLGHNRLERLRDDFLRPDLAKSLKELSVVDNNMMELPFSIVDLDEEMPLFEAEYNPFRSPPPEVLGDGLKTVRKYYVIRSQRMRELRDLLEEADFDTDVAHYSPVARRVLTGKTGFLTPKDLQEFDSAVDQFVNAEYYRCPASAEEIVQRIEAMRDQREFVMFSTILKYFLMLLEELMQMRQDIDERVEMAKKRDEPADRALHMEHGEYYFSENEFGTVTRKWGRDREMANCWTLKLSALLRHSEPNVFVHEYRPSVFDLLLQRLPPSPFEVTHTMLKDALRMFRHPYGKVADTEKLQWDECECIDRDTGEPARHWPCIEPAVVILKSIFTEKEADRREMEEHILMEKFKEVDTEISIFLRTPNGKRLLDKAVRHRRRNVSEGVKVRQALVKDERDKLDKLQERLDRVRMRKARFEQGAPFKEHKINDVDHAETLIASVNGQIRAVSLRLNELATQLQQWKEKRSLETKVVKKHASDDLLQKYCYRAYDVIMDEKRMQASHNGWRRPWDGPDGELFDKWLKHRHLTLVVHEDPNGDIPQHMLVQSLAEAKLAEESVAEERKSQVGVFMAETSEERLDSDSDAESEDGEYDNIDFDDMDDMSVYACAVFDKFNRDERGAAMRVFRDIRNDIGGRLGR